jgi:hypothetical protein
MSDEEKLGLITLILIVNILLVGAVAIYSVAKLVLWIVG